MNIIQQYIISKIHLNTLCILFCLMIVIAGFEKLGYLEKLAQHITQRAQNRRRLSVMLVLLCFFLSMLVTNDVALILFVPFTISLYTDTKNEATSFVLIMETIAANLGSMATPIGNPQNLYLYQRYNMNIITFIKTIGPYSILSLILLLALTGLYKRKKTDFLSTEDLLSDRKISFSLPSDNNSKNNMTKTITYTILFILSLLSVFAIVPYYITFIIVIISILLSDRKLFRLVNYGLLQKFVLLFLIVGNIAEIPVIYSLLSKIIKGHELLCGIAFSQIMSNVPTAVMLSSFTENGAALMLGTNLGGLGTLIASMASVITYEFYGKLKGCSRKNYLCSFTLWNLLFLIAMLCFYHIIKKFC